MSKDQYGTPPQRTCALPLKTDGAPVKLLQKSLSTVHHVVAALSWETVEAHWRTSGEVA